MPYYTEEEVDLIVDGIREEQEAELFDLVPIYPGSTIYQATPARKEEP